MSNFPALLILRCSAGRQRVGALDVRHRACQIASHQVGPRWATRDVKGSDEKTGRKSD
jgi:hypothetical protein